MRLAVVSDLHWSTDPAVRAAWHNPFDFAGLPGRIDTARAGFERAGADAVVACGDLTHFGDAASARAAFERLAAHRVLAVAGNHDCLERDDQLGRCVAGDAELLTADGIELDGVRLAGVSIERDAEAGTFRWTGGGELAGGDRVSLVASHYPVLSRAARLAERGFAYPGDLTNRRTLHARLRGAGAVIVLSGHIHARESHSRGNVLQLFAGALIEAPYEAAIVDVSLARTEVRVRRRVLVLGPSAGRRDPVLAPEQETWRFRDGGWRR